MKTALPLSLLAIAVLAGCAHAPRDAATASYDLLIRNGVVYDGSGEPPRRVDIAVNGDRVAALLPAGASARATREVDANGLAVAPGFINMLSWATESLLVDGRGISDTKQGVTLEIFGEGWSMGPLNPAMKAEALRQQGDLHFPIPWDTLGGYLEHLQAQGVTPNVASFIGAATVRIHELGETDVQPDAAQLARMQQLVRQAMAEGALGVGASLIYPPGFYAKTPELIALTQAAAESGGGYIAHMRSEANGLLEAVDETLSIARASGARAEIYHLKAAGEVNWPKMQQAIAKIEAARAEGVNTGANMYVYPAGGTGLLASLPPWVQSGGLDATLAQLRRADVRARVIADMKNPGAAWENLRLLAGSADRLKFFGFKSEALKPLTGRSLGEVARERGTSPEDTIIDLLLADGSRIDTAYFLMSEENIELGLRQPWVSLGSDAESSAPEGVFLKSSTHPRAYGNVARFLGHYVRDRGLMPLEEAVRRLTRLPAQNWKLAGRGCLDPGCHADLVIFDAAQIRDHATFEQPQQYSTGVRDVWVNGVQVLRDGEHTGAKPGRVVRGPGWKGK